MKTVYQYDRAGVYIGETIADESPLESGVYLMPAGTTAKAPPSNIPAGKMARWNGSQWDVVTKPEPQTVDPVAKLADFLAQNPDVAALIQTNNGGTNV